MSSEVPYDKVWGLGKVTTPMYSLEICAGAGGQALGLEQAGFEHVALVEIDRNACATLRHNRPHWNVFECDVASFSAKKYLGIDLLAGGVPCPPFSIAGKQLGQFDGRDLFPEALRLVEECRPKAVMLENVRGLFAPKFVEYRSSIKARLEQWGYACTWEIVNALDHGIPQQRPRAILVALKREYAPFFVWPQAITDTPTIGQLLHREMASNGWAGATEWSQLAIGCAPAIVGGSRKHGGPDLGPTRAKAAWAKLGVDGRGLADQPPREGFKGLPQLTVRMAALVQGFPLDWEFVGKKTPAYRQVGNAFPPPVAKAVGAAIIRALSASSDLLETLQGEKVRSAV